MSETVLRPAARAIVLNNGCLLVMRRNKLGRRYMVIPGGRLEPGEEPEMTVLRELAEETMIEVVNPRLVFIEEPNDQRWGTQYIYLCEYVSGEPRLHPDSEEMHSNSEGSNLYEPMWLPLSELSDQAFPFRSARLAEEITAGVKNGFPETPKRWTLNPPVIE